MSHRRLLLPGAAFAAVVLTLPGCVFSIGGGHRHPHPTTIDNRHLSPQDREQIALAEAFAAESFSELQTDGLVKLAGRPDLTPAARLRIVELARGLSFSQNRRAVLAERREHRVGDAVLAASPCRCASACGGVSATRLCRLA